VLHHHHSHLSHLSTTGHNNNHCQTFAMFFGNDKLQFAIDLSLLAFFDFRQLCVFFWPAIFQTCLFSLLAVALGSHELKLVQCGLVITADTHLMSRTAVKLFVSARDSM